MAGGAVTPQSNRAPADLALNLRNSFESEIWDDNASVVFVAKDLLVDTIVAGATLAVCSLEVGTPVKCRLEVHAQARAEAGGATSIWSAAVRQDTVATDVSSSTNTWPAGFAANIAWFGEIDLEPGKYTLDMLISVSSLSANMDFYNKKILARRGRKPSSVT